MNYSLKCLAVSALVILTSCQTGALTSKSVSPDQARPLASTLSVADRPAPALAPAAGALAEVVDPALKIPHQGSVSIQGSTLTLSLRLPPLPFRTQLLDLAPAALVTATVKDSRGMSYVPNGADGNGRVAYPVDGHLLLSFNNVVPDDLLLIEAQVKTSAAADIPQAELAAALRHTGIGNPSAILSFQSTAVAKTLKALLAANPARARAISLPDLESLLGSITGITGTAPNYTYPANHPSLVKTSALATALVSAEPAALSASAASFRGLGASLALTVSGLKGADKLKVQLSDAATPIKGALGNGSGGASFALSKATPGSGLSLKVSSDGTPVIPYTFSVSPAILPDLLEAGNQPVTITATPILEITGFTPASALAGRTVTLTGRGFTGTTAVSFNGLAATSFTVDSDTQVSAVVPANASASGQIALSTPVGTVSSTGSFSVLAPAVTAFSPSSGQLGSTVTITGSRFTGATAVLFNGVSSSSITVDSDTQITATVPATATDGKITVTNGLNGLSSGNFNVNRPWFVNVNASGNNSGTSWTDAFTSLQSALTASAANDEIWIAAGTYKPDPSNTAISFQMKSNVNIYGGFASGATALGDRNPVTNEVILSGDLSDDDDRSVTPFTSLTPNSVTVINGAGSSLLDSVTVQGATGTGMVLGGSSMSLNRVSFKHNQSSGSAGGMSTSGGTVQLTDVKFYNNYAGSFGGGILNNSGTMNLTGGYFEGNVSSSRGGCAIFNSGNVSTIRNVTFVNNRCLGVEGVLHYFISNGGLLENAVFKNNSASEGAINIEALNADLTVRKSAVTGQTGGAAIRMNVYNGSSTPVNVNLENMLVANNSSTLRIFGSASVARVNLRNVTVANNNCTTQPEGRCTINNSIPSVSNYQNLLLWRDKLGAAPATEAGTVDFANGVSPFLDASDPDGLDDIWFTALDGFELNSGATAAVDAGVTGADIPTQDIVGRARIGNPEPGAYEYGY